MARPKVEGIAQLRLSDTEGIQFRWSPRKGVPGSTYFLEPIPGAIGWQAILEHTVSDPNSLKSHRDKKQDTYLKTLHKDPAYRAAAGEFFESQNRDPQPINSWFGRFWTFRGTVYVLYLREWGNPAQEVENARLLVKHHVLGQERDFKLIRRELEALENLERMQGPAREPVPEAVRLFVWQRAKGQCVKCGGRERLEFDHIIPIATGGSNTERNVQLLCEACNRSKGATI